MKQILLIFLLVLSISIQAQNNLGKSDDNARIVLSSYIPPQIENFPKEASNILLSKLDNITTQKGMGGGRNASRFIITANIVVLNKNITPSAPPKHMYNLEVTYYIGDAVTGTKYSTTSETYLGIANSEIKAYIAALSQINPKDKIFTEFLQDAKTKIIEYYNSQCDFILKDAQTLAGIKKYDEAIYTLASVPEVCKECYMKCSDQITEVYKAKIENECQQNIAQAKTLIAQNNYNDAASLLSPILPDMQCYAKAEALIKDINDHRCAVALGEAKGYWVSHDVSSTSMALSSIPTDSKCYSEAMVLAKEVEKYVKDTEKRDFEVMKQQIQNEQDAKMATIKSARDVGVAYGNNQPKTITTYNIKGWW